MAKAKKKTKAAGRASKRVTRSKSKTKRGQSKTLFESFLDLFK